MDYNATLYPFAERVRGCFSQNVIGAVDIGIEAQPIACLVDASLRSSPRKDGLCFDLPIGREEIPIEEGSHTGVGLLLQEDLYPNQ
jgi:hypothetical protein